MTSCSVRTGPDQLPVSVEIGFCIAVEFDTEVIELLAVVDGLLNHHATVCLGRDRKINNHTQDWFFGQFSEVAEFSREVASD